jgi:hypothetical protein
MNSLKENLVRHKRIIPVIVAIVAIAAYMIPAHLASAAVSGSGNAIQSVTQSNSVSASNSGKYGGAFADNNVLTNVATNGPNNIHIVGGPYSGYIGGVSNSGNAVQQATQSNSVTATNTGDGTPTNLAIASASNNLLTNTATNGPNNIHISNNGGGSSGVTRSGNAVQLADQSNSVSATNSGANGAAVADFNTLKNTATNTADVHISNHGSSQGSGNSGTSDNGGSSKGVSDSANVVQVAKQSNSVSASNSGDNGVADASGNSLSNSASNSAHVDISNSNNVHKDNSNKDHKDNNKDHKDDVKKKLKIVG